MKKLLCVLLGAVMALSLCACGIPSIPGVSNLIPSMSKGVVGTWEADLDMSESMKDAMTGDGELELDLDDVTFIIKMRLTLNDDDTYSIAVDEDQVRDMTEKLIESVKKPLVETIKKELESSGISISDLLKMVGAESLDAYVSELLEDELDTDELVESLLEGNTDGTYEVKDNKVFFDGEDEESAVLDGGKLILTGDAVADLPEELLPVTFKKVG